MTPAQQWFALGIEAAMCFGPFLLLTKVALEPPDPPAAA